MANEANNNLNDSIENKVNNPKKEVNLVDNCASEFVKQYLKNSSGRVKFANDIMNS